jgi:hypothetical protein
MRRRRQYSMRSQSAEPSSAAGGSYGGTYAAASHRTRSRRQSVTSRSRAASTRKFLPNVPAVDHSLSTRADTTVHSYELGTLKPLQQQQPQQQQQQLDTYYQPAPAQSTSSRYTSPEPQSTMTSGYSAVPDHYGAAGSVRQTRTPVRPSAPRTNPTPSAYTNPPAPPATVAAGHYTSVNAQYVGM